MNLAAINTALYYSLQLLNSLLRNYFAISHPLFSNYIQSW